MTDPLTLTLTSTLPPTLRQRLVRRWQTDFDRERALADLDESVASREQAVADHEQERLDVLQSGLDAEIRHLPKGPDSSQVDIAHRQAELTRAQDRRDARQEQLNEAQKRAR